MLSIILIVEKEKKLYAEIYHSNKNIANTTYTLF